MINSLTVEKLFKSSRWIPSQHPAVHLCWEIGRWLLRAKITWTLDGDVVTIGIGPVPVSDCFP